MDVSSISFLTEGAASDTYSRLFYHRVDPKLYCPFALAGVTTDGDLSNP